MSDAASTEPLGTITRAEAERGRFFDGRPPIVGELMRSRDPRVLIHGPQGTGKTRLLLEKLRACCLKYERTRWILLRSVRKWLTNSALVTWEEKVVVPGELVPDRIQRQNRSEYRFRNGSIVTVAGLDDPQAVFSTEYDGAVLIEANEVSRDSVEKLDGRLRFNRMPYQQMLLDCNPQSPRHWLYKAMTEPVANDNSTPKAWLRGLEMRHLDNPALYDANGQKTKYGEAYLARLDSMTGVRRARLRDGRWVQAEGVVYDRWDERVNVVRAFRPPGDWRRLWSIDFGYSNPFVWQLWAIDPDDRMYLYREIYRTKLLVEDAAAMIRQNTHDEPAPIAIVCDHDREDRATLERHLGMSTVAAIKDVRSGIDAVATRMRPAGDGRPRLFIMDSTLIHSPDESLMEAKEPTHTLAELDEYAWKKSQNGDLAKDEPEKVRDHGCDAKRYAVMHVDGGGPRSNAESYSAPGPDEQIDRIFGPTRGMKWD